MKIAFFCDSYKPTRNGVAVSVATTAQELRARGHRVVIYAPEYHGYVDRETDIIRFPAAHYANGPDFPVAWPLVPYSLLGIHKQFHDEHFDIVHSHSPFVLGTVGSRWARIENIPVIFTFHTLYHRYLHYYKPMPPRAARAYALWQIRRYCELCDHIIAPSQAVARVATRFRPDVPISVLPTGVNTEKFAGGNGAPVRRKYAIACEERVLLYVGRLAQEKNLPFLIESLAPLLRDASTPARLMLVGGGPYEEELKALVREMQLESRVVFTGFIESGDLADYYAAGDIFVFASRTETQGVCIAEALAAGLPCVVVNAMGAAESVKHGSEGFIVPPRAEAFRDAVAQLVRDDELRARMTQNAQAKSDSLSLQRRVGTLLEIYRTVRAAVVAPAG